MASLSSSKLNISLPSIKTFPLVGRSTPPIKCKSVDLPEPLAPTIATNSPFSTLKETLSNATTLVVPLP